jgi:hypothetical protein
MSFREIAAVLPITQSTARRWTLDIALSPEHQVRLQAKAKATRLRGSRIMAANHRERREQWQREGRERAKLGDALHEGGCLLYWAEGTKGRNVVALSNSDVNLMRFFLRFLRSCFEVPDEDLAFNLNVYTDNGLTIEEIESHWLRELELPRSCLRKHVLDHRTATTTGLKKGKLPYGTACLRVARSTKLLQHIYGAIQEYAGFEEPRWLG